MRLCLRHIAGYRFRVDAVVLHQARQVFRLAFRIDENHRPDRIHAAQQADQQRRLFGVARVVDGLRHAIHRHLVRLDQYRFRFVHVFVCEFEYALVQRRREHQVQALLGVRQSTQDVANILDEAEVEHPVGFVEHDDLNLIEVVYALFVVVDQAAGRTDQDIDAIDELVALLVIIRAAEYDLHPEIGGLAQHLGIGM